ncbi:hypothetical protein LAZ40_16815 [Cereibacter sphaeroides]|uniref:histidine kinase n=1 Tax=Rhodobacterales TaxID=204455 RepID=UPI000BBEB11C|nr:MULTISPECIES: histidine kinase [Paracoccaceae]MCE6951364.1 hypothetical protein [Cereibacter sphaeroides]MCE6960689.1 hypothetical protein [Cereibacter sphaeroides]MCE6970044.1 hypothetical protein [Cereibacter sphaeroides]MCE6973209.1 hypothetical protein [Cereibacter sphaeroides]
MNETTPNVKSAEDLRMMILKRELEEMAKRDAERSKKDDQLRKFADDFLTKHVTDEERAAIQKLVQNAVNNGKFEALVYSFPSDLCTDSGRAIHNHESFWPETLQGKARELYDRYVEVAKPQGYKLKASIINFPGGMPGDVGLFLNWEEDRI